MRTLTRLSDINPAYAFVKPDGMLGLLVREAENGDTHFPPYNGTWNILEPAESLADAEAKAREWEGQA